MSKDILEDRHQPLEALIHHVSDGRLSIDQATELVDQAETMVCMDLDDLNNTMFVGRIVLPEADISFGATSFYNLHRAMYESGHIMGVSSVEVGFLCLKASRKIKYTAGEYSFQNALAYCFERENRMNEAALHIQAAKLMEKAGQDLFIEIFIRSSKIESAGILQSRDILENMVSSGKKANTPSTEFHGWRGLALMECDLGNPAGALRNFRQAISCARTFLEPIPMIILLGDYFWVALHADSRRQAQFLAENLANCIEQMPDYMACNAILRRTAKLCRDANISSPLTSINEFLDDRFGQEVLAQEEAKVPTKWNVGDVLLGLYKVTGILGEGGMGKVYKVYHQGWNLDLAVKSPRPEIFTSTHGKEDFERECEIWVNLGLHPHTVSCYYVRRLDGIPCIFAEYVEGGSLGDWIRYKYIYEGGQQKSLERILDIAIQFAWGLHYAHENALVHQDVRPENVMMTTNGIAKVTDFSLTKARRMAGDVKTREIEQSVTGLGFHPHYCSPEQVAGKRLTRKTDIWSWAVSILEIFMGIRKRTAGELADEELENYLAVGKSNKNIPEMPEPLIQLLRRCLQREPSDRPRDMLEIALTLQEVYNQVTGHNYPREYPEPAELLADSLNNRAVSHMDIGKRMEAEKAWEKALQEDPQHLAAMYNRGIMLWRHGELTDEELVLQIESIRDLYSKDWHWDNLLAQIHLERGDMDLAAKLLEDAVSKGADPAVIDIARSSHDRWSKCIRVCSDRSKSVSSVAISKDGLLGISGGGGVGGGMVSYWNLQTGETKKELQGITDSVESVAIDAKGLLGFTGEQNGKLRVWDLDTGKCLRTMEAQSSPLCCVAMTPDGKYGICGSGFSTFMPSILQLWELSSGKCLMALTAHMKEPEDVVLTPDSRYALTGHRDTALRLWGLTQMECLGVLIGHGDSIRGVAISEDGKVGLSGSLDKTLRVWDLQTGSCLKILEGHTDRVLCVAMTSDGKRAVSGGDDATVRLWDIKTGRCLRTFGGHSGPVEGIAITPEGRYALSGSQDGTIRWWMLGETRRSAFQLSFPLPTIEAVEAQTKRELLTQQARSAFAKDLYSEAIYYVEQARSIGGSEKLHELLDLYHQIGQKGRKTYLRNSWCRRILQKHEGVVRCVAISSDGRFGLSASNDGTIVFWDLSTGQMSFGLDAQTNPVRAVALTQDGRRALSAGGGVRFNPSDLLTDLRRSGGAGSKTKLITDGDPEKVLGGPEYSVNYWDMENGLLLSSLAGHSEPVTSVAITSDGQFGLSSSGDCTLRLWDLQLGKCLQIFEGHSQPVASIAITPDCQYALSGGSEGGLRLWNLPEKRCVMVLGDSMHAVTSVAVTPDGRCGLSSISGNKVCLWDLQMGECIKTLKGSPGSIICVAITADGRYALSGGQNIRLWDLKTGQCLQIMEEHTEKIESVSFTNDGRYAISGSRDKTVRLWEFEWEYEFPKDDLLR